MGTNEAIFDVVMKDTTSCSRNAACSTRSAGKTLRSRGTPRRGCTGLICVMQGGRTIALAIDGSHRLLFSNFAAKDAGRAHGAFWDAMLGWLMRDPRFEPAVVDVKGGCIAGEDATLELRPLSGQKGDAVLKVVRLGSDPRVYAESILEACHLFVASPRPCVASVTGSDLKTRIGQLLAGG